MFEDIIEEEELQEKSCGTCGHGKFVSENVGTMCTKSRGLTCALNLDKPFKYWIPKDKL